MELPRCIPVLSYAFQCLLLRLSENAHLPFDTLTALSKAEGLRYPHPSSLRRTQKVKGRSPSAVSSGPNGLKANEKKPPEVFCFCLEPRSSSLEPADSHASFLGMSEALHLDIFHQPQRIRFFDSFIGEYASQKTYARIPQDSIG